MSVPATTEKEDDDEFLFKAIIIGDSGVGKSCILLRFAKNEFKKEHNVTIGVDFATKFIQVDKDTKVKLQIWDTAGQETFRSIVKTFFKKAAIVFLVYDVNRRDSFKSLSNWIEKARNECDPKVIYILMGNKSDQPEANRQVKFEEGTAFMEQNNISFFFETSALTGDYIEKAFTEGTKLAFLQFVNQSLERAPTPPGFDRIDLNESKSKKDIGENQAQKSGCC